MLSVQDLSREFTARFFELAGHDVQAKFLRKMRDNPKVFQDAWGKPGNVKATILDVMNHIGSMVMAAYIEDLLTESLKKVEPVMDEGFMRWAMRARVHEHVDFFLTQMPFSIDHKWGLISANLFHAGYTLHSTTHCFVSSKG